MATITTPVATDTTLARAAAALEGILNNMPTTIIGTTFTPSVSSAGVISWTNDGGKQNPQNVDLVAAVLDVLPTWTGGNY